MKASLTHILQRIPGKVTPKWPMGERFASALAHGTMSVEVYAPKGVDPQTPHDQDELYIIVSGNGEFVLRGERMQFAAGDVLFVPAGDEHRFENFTDDIVTWVVFYGAKGGEK
jgi:mannose-6-phosphate isomerase-like protein (cupin superfamily)